MGGLDGREHRCLVIKNNVRILNGVDEGKSFLGKCLSVNDLHILGSDADSKLLYGECPVVKHKVVFFRKGQIQLALRSFRIIFGRQGGSDHDVPGPAQRGGGHLIRETGQPVSLRLGDQSVGHCLLKRNHLVIFGDHLDGGRIVRHDLSEFLYLIVRRDDHIQFDGGGEIYRIRGAPVQPAGGDAVGQCLEIGIPKE